MGVDREKESKLPFQIADNVQNCDSFWNSDSATVHSRKMNQSCFVRSLSADNEQFFWSRGSAVLPCSVQWKQNYEFCCPSLISAALMVLIEQNKTEG